MNRTTRILIAATTLTVSGLGLAGTASAQLCSNTCTPAITGQRAGVHTQFDGSADAVLWPPNHKARTIQVSAINDDGDECDVTITDIRQDEPINGEGDGNTSPDALNCSNAGNDSTVDLRGERAGNGTGRYYHVMFNMEDPDCPMMPAMDDGVVLVPHDQGVAHINTYIDEGPLYASYDTATLECE